MDSNFGKYVGIGGFRVGIAVWGLILGLNDRSAESSIHCPEPTDVLLIISRRCATKMIFLETWMARVYFYMPPGEPKTI